MITLEDLDFSKSSTWNLPIEMPSILDVDERTGEFLSPIKRVGSRAQPGSSGSSRRAVQTTSTTDMNRPKAVSSRINSGTCRSSRRPNSNFLGTSELRSGLSSPLIAGNSVRPSTSNLGVGYSESGNNGQHSSKLFSKIPQCKTVEECDSIIDSMEGFFGRGGSAAPAKRTPLCSINSTRSTTQNFQQNENPTSLSGFASTLKLPSAKFEGQSALSSYQYQKHQTSSSHSTRQNHQFSHFNNEASRQLATQCEESERERQKNRQSPPFPTQHFQTENNMLFSATVPVPGNIGRPFSRRGKRDESANCSKLGMHQINSQPPLRKVHSSSAMTAAGFRAQR